MHPWGGSLTQSCAGTVPSSAERPWCSPRPSPWWPRCRLASRATWSCSPSTLTVSPAATRCPMLCAEEKLWVSLGPTTPAPGPWAQPPTHLEVALTVHREGEAPAPEAGHCVGQAGMEPAAQGAGGPAVQAQGSVQLTPCTLQCQAPGEVGSHMGV